MALLFNPGSGPVDDKGDGYTNTYAKACEIARTWFEDMKADGLADIELVEPQPWEVDGGRWTFIFRHTITGAEVKLETHGLDNLDTYTINHVFLPRVYWNGWSSGQPELDDFAAPGFVPVRLKTYRPATVDG